MGLRDVAAKGVEGDREGLRTATVAGIQAVDLTELCGRQFEVEHVDVLCDGSPWWTSESPIAPLADPNGVKGLGAVVVALVDADAGPFVVEGAVRTGQLRSARSSANGKIFVNLQSARDFVAGETSELEVRGQEKKVRLT